MKTAPMSARPGAQRGVTLVVVMLILVVVMILGVGGAQIALLGERSTRYERDYLIASQSAEAALMDAEFDIDGPNGSASSRVAQFTQTNLMIFKDGCGTDPVSPTSDLGLCNPAPAGTKPVWATVDFTSDTNAVPFGTFTGRTFTAGSTGIQPALTPHYIIEVVPDALVGGSAAGTSQKWIYRITAMGFGPRQEVQVVMQTAYRKP
jgi:type IV pilus assembly protein PilX